MGVGVVRGGELNSGDEVLVEEELADVGDDSSTVRTVGVGCSVEVCEDVDVRSAGGVVAWDDGREGCNTLRVCGLEPAEESGVEVGCVGAISVA